LNKTEEQGEKKKNRLVQLGKIVWLWSHFPTGYLPVAYDAMLISELSNKSNIS